MKITTGGEPRPPNGASQATNGDNNSHNQHLDVFTYCAIDAALSTSEQTYAQMLHSFSHLNSENILPPSTNPSSSHVEGNQEERKPSLSARDTEEVTYTSQAVCHVMTEAEELEEEVLQEGTRVASVLMRTSATTGGVIAQVDNFVDDEGSPLSDEDGDAEGDSDDELGLSSSSYQASFAPVKPQVSGESKATTRANTSRNRFDESQNEHRQSVTTDQKTGQDFSHNRDKEGDSESDKSSKQSTLDTSLTMEDAPDISSTIVINTGDSKKAKETPSSTSPGVDHDVCDSDSDLEYDPSYDTPNPGEIEDETGDMTAEEVKNIRQLDFSAKVGSTLVTAASTETENTTSEIETDEVEPFSLDEEFDYDNVVLTPKFTSEEREYLNSFVKPNPSQEPCAENEQTMTGNDESGNDEGKEGT